MTLDEILIEIKEAQKIVVLTHESPDGDAIRKCISNEINDKSFAKRCRCYNSRI